MSHEAAIEGKLLADYDLLCATRTCVLTIECQPYRVVLFCFSLFSCKTLFAVTAPKQSNL